jgi:4-amino-4-deoxychorismate lyase
MRNAGFIQLPIGFKTWHQYWWIVKEKFFQIHVQHKGVSIFKMTSLELDSATKAIISEPSFEIISTLAYSAGLPPNPHLINASPVQLSHGYLLSSAIDRLCAAATELQWSLVSSNLEQDGRSQAIEEEIRTHMREAHGNAMEDAGRQFIVRLAFRKDGKLNIISGPRQRNPAVPYYPISVAAIMQTSAPDEIVIPVYIDTQSTVPSVLTKHKTTYREPYNLAWERVGLDPTVAPSDADALLHNTSGEIMGGAFRTVYFLRNGGCITPSSNCGGKISVSRRWALENSDVNEAVILVSDLKDREVVWLSSAVTGFTKGIITLETRPKLRLK